MIYATSSQENGITTSAGIASDTLSQSSAFTNRAVSLLDSVRQAVTPAVNKEFLGVLQAFKRKQIDSKTTLAKVTKILEDYPALLNKFTMYLPEGSNVTTSSPTKKEQQQQPAEQHQPEILPPFSSALAFVQKVKVAYAEKPEVYEHFLSLLRNYQRGVVAQKDVVLAVSSLLSDTSDLALEFKAFYGSSTEAEALTRADSNDTMAPPSPPRPSLAKTPRFVITGRSNNPRSGAGGVNLAESNTPFLTSYGSTATSNDVEESSSTPLLSPESAAVGVVAKSYSPCFQASVYFSIFLLLTSFALAVAFSLGWLSFL